MGCCTKRTILRVAAVLGVLGIAGAACLVWMLWPTHMPPPAWATDYDLTARQPDTIAPGTVVPASAPDGWSHLVIKSLPRIRPEHEKQVNALTVRMTRWMFTAFVADVRPEHLGGETRYRLRTVGFGLGTSFGGRDVIVTPETAATHSVELNWITRTLLTKGYETIQLAKVIVHGPTFGLVDTPVWYRCGEVNRLIRFRYALLVDAATGRLDVLVWALDPAGGCGDVGTVLLAANQLDPAELVPDLKTFNVLGIPSETSFGVDRLPPHQARVTIPNELRDLGAKTHFTADEARALEADLRRLLP